MAAVDGLVDPGITGRDIASKTIKWGLLTNKFKEQVVICFKNH